MFLLIELLLCMLPLCLGRMVESQQLGRNKIFLHNKDASHRALEPTLNIRNGPEERVEVTVGESKFLECEAGGTPPPTLHWLKDGHKIPQTFSEPSPVVESNLGLGFTRSRLFLDCASPSDAGRYTCVAENEYIRAFKSSQVLVTDSMSADSGAMCLARKTFGLPARIFLWTHSRLEVMGSDVQLFCQASGNPHPHVAWKGPNKKTLNDPKKYEVLPSGDLLIRQIMWGDMGGYTCQAKNTEGVDEATVFLYPTLPENDPGY